MKWVPRGVAGLGLFVVAWCCATAWPAIVHGNLAYALMLTVTLVVSLLIGLSSFGERRRSRGWRLVGTILAALVAVAWLGLVAWLRPFSALEPALTAMVSDTSVTVVETPGAIVMTPVEDVGSAGVFFQPGAKVEARAYAAVLRPLAVAGYTVVIPKQPLGIAFLAMGAFESAREANPQIAEWVVGGHSLGGTVAAMDAEDHGADEVAPVTGLLLYASYPASDMSTTLHGQVLSLSASEDGLATPADIETSRAHLPTDAQFVVIDGAVHAYFGDYGPQPGDGTPLIGQDEARTQISEQSLALVSRSQMQSEVS